MTTKGQTARTHWLAIWPKRLLVAFEFALKARTLTREDRHRLRALMDDFSSNQEGYQVFQDLYTKPAAEEAQFVADIETCIKQASAILDQYPRPQAPSTVAERIRRWRRPDTAPLADDPRLMSAKAEFEIAGLWFADEKYRHQPRRYDHLED